jgi:putative membrane protein insertion efficiency factor
MLAKTLIGIIRIYQFFSKAFLQGHCRFYPGCSEYMVMAIQKHGVFVGVRKGIGRIMRCHPNHPGGVDMP